MSAMFGSRVSHQFDHNLNLNLSNQYLFQLSSNGNATGSRQSSATSFVSPWQPQKPVGVFWDIENCSIPRGIAAYGLVAKIRALFAHYNLIEREFAVVCDVYGINQSTINELNDMQVNVIHVCSYSKNASDEKLKQQIYRFVMAYGHACTVVLLSSDINFAPLLSDIKNRIGISVILFHHRQVSPALVACAHQNFDFDYFCAQIPQTTTASRGQLEIDTPAFNYNSHNSEAYLTISNWPRTFTEDNARMFLNRITSNSGGRVIHVDFRNYDATVMFKCKADAQRCMQRVHNRRIHGFTLRANISVNLNARQPPQQQQQQPTMLAAGRSALNVVTENGENECSAEPPPPPLPSTQPLLIQPSSSSSSSSAVIESKSKNQRTSSPNVWHNTTMTPFLRKLKANRCEKCNNNRDGQRKSIHSNFLFKYEILAVHISLGELSKKIDQLFASHSDRLTLNSLPHCWLFAFGQEIDTQNEPKVMLEHLLHCLPQIEIRTVNVKVDGQKIASKIIIKRGSHKLSLPRQPKPKMMKQKKLQTLTERLHSLVVGNATGSLTTFPTIKLSELCSKFEAKYGQKILGKESVTAEKLIVLFSHVKEKFNLYSFGDDYLVGLSSDEQKKCFVDDFRRALSAHQSAAKKEQIDFDSLLEIFKQYFGADLNMAIYGVCFIDDMIECLKGDFGTKQSAEKAATTDDDDEEEDHNEEEEAEEEEAEEEEAEKEEEAEEEEAEKEETMAESEEPQIELPLTDLPIIDLTKCAPLVRRLLQSQTNCAIEAKHLHRHFLSKWRTRLGVPVATVDCDYTQFVRSISAIDSKHFCTVSDGESDWIVLARKEREAEFAKRLLRAFYLMCMVDDRGDERECAAASFSIGQVFANYLHVFGAEPLLYDPDHDGRSLAKVFERALVHVYDNRLDDNFCLIYECGNEVTLHKRSAAWFDDQAFEIFAILLGTESHSLPWRRLRQEFHRKHGYAIGPSTLRNARLRKIVFLRKDANNDFHLRLSAVFEFAAMCLAVMLLHRKWREQADDDGQADDDEDKSWSIAKLEAEYYDHFGVCLRQPSTFGVHDYKRLFDCIDCLFDINHVEEEEDPEDHHRKPGSSELRIRIRRPDFLLSRIDLRQLSTCNYCQQNVPKALNDQMASE